MNRKYLLYILAGLFAAVLLWQFLVEGVLGRFDSLDRNIAARKKTLEEIRQLEQTYARGKDELTGLDAVLRGRGKDYTPISFLERLSVESGVKYELVYREPRPIRDEDNLMEASVRVELREIDTAGLVKYLYRVENSGEFLMLRNLNIRPQEGLLRAGFEVSTIVPAP